MKLNLRTIATLVFFFGILLSGCGAGASSGQTATSARISTATIPSIPTFTQTVAPTLTPTIPQLPTSTATIAGTPTPAPKLIDDFNDRVICALWETYGTDQSRIVSEENGMLNLEISKGPALDGNGQSVGVESGGFILHGDFDVQVDYELGAPIQGSDNFSLVLTDQKANTLEINILKDGYYLAERYHMDNNLVYNLKGTFSINARSGRMRITRVNNEVTMYVGDSGLNSVQMGNQGPMVDWGSDWYRGPQWEPIFAQGDLKVGFNLWNTSPDFLPLTARIDNLKIYNAATAGCVP